MKSNQQGIILFNTVLTISLVTLMVLAQMQLVFLYIKTSNKLISNHQEFYNLEAEVNKLLTKKGWSVKCFTQETNPDNVVMALKSNQGCEIFNDKGHYRFLIEDMGFFPCLQTRLDGQVYSTRHWRLSMIANLQRTLILQVRVAEASQFQVCKRMDAVVITTGIISWRYLG